MQSQVLSANSLTAFQAVERLEVQRWTGLRREVPAQQHNISPLHRPGIESVSLFIGMQCQKRNATFPDDMVWLSFPGQCYWLCRFVENQCRCLRLHSLVWVAYALETYLRSKIEILDLWIAARNPFLERAIRRSVSNSARSPKSSLRNTREPSFKTLILKARIYCSVSGLHSDITRRRWVHTVSWLLPSLPQQPHTAT